jgi:glycosyl hydrolase family 3
VARSQHPHAGRRGDDLAQLGERRRPVQALRTVGVVAAPVDLRHTGSCTSSGGVADCAAASRCAVVVVSGRPLIVEPAQLDELDALVAAWLPASKGAGVADTLFGRRPFTGRLPVSWPRRLEQEPINVGDADYDPLYPFGYGLRSGREPEGLFRDSRPGGVRSRRTGALIRCSPSRARRARRRSGRSRARAGGRVA